MNGFICGRCRATVGDADRFLTGTRHRDHCPHCLWSKHLDRIPGDRNAHCGGLMQPIGITFKTEGGEPVGEPMVVYQCLDCGVVHKNRIAADDDNASIISVYCRSLKQPPTTNVIALADARSARLLLTRLFGKHAIPRAYRKQFGLD
ncbi:RNHCP domain-containing protein [Patescibacteria group bacterium]|nr:RNHCP domain-containing protein [Patescibacteria group bacterium]MCL5091902.1 RNHCP domain-containing protein [Patescibacteria group bacterium]